MVMMSSMGMIATWLVIFSRILQVVSLQRLVTKGISLYARFDYALGHTLYNDLAARSLGQYQGSFNVIDKVKDTWSEANPNSDLPKFYYADQLSKKNINPFQR